MIFSYKGWKSLFIGCFGLFIGTAFCMKWMEGHFIANNELFTIIGLEISYPKSQVIGTLSGLSDKVKTILQFHLYFDFAFMTGVYTGIAALCMMARFKVANNTLSQLLLVFAILQIVAFGADIAENSYLLKWIDNPVIGKEFATYHLIVITKWSIALSGILFSLLFVFRKQKIA